MIAEGIRGARDDITPRLRLMNGTRDWEWIGLSDRLEKIAPRKNLLMCADQTLLSIKTNKIKLFTVSVATLAKPRELETTRRIIAQDAIYDSPMICIALLSRD